MYCADEMVEAFCSHTFLYLSLQLIRCMHISPIFDKWSLRQYRKKIPYFSFGGVVAAGVINPDLEKRSSRIMWKEKKIRLHYVDAHVFALVEKSVLEDHRVSDQRVLCSRLRDSRLEYGGTVFFVPLQPWMDRHYPQKKNRDSNMQPSQKKKRILFWRSFFFRPFRFHISALRRSKL